MGADRGPGHTPEQLARVAFKKHVRLARLEGGALGIGGVVTLAPDMVALLWIQSRMVFYIAAAYGYDPRHPMRPAEYLALQGLYETPARGARGARRRGQAHGPGDGRATRSARRRTDALHLKLAKYLAQAPGAPLRRQAASR